ncbi:hypothetical protein H4219_001044 [Mycoemilia scoparia]|uniref:ATP synthase mitochondrial F1 complex assembly factor 1 n=1 Tax=Mycoemilia scoparia TaxID=417184 RepID=A0A9W8DWI8_9FUNG|nr:hypothetical protein H4219_001044 [Mycoemilia scoparia]
MYFLARYSARIADGRGLFSHALTGQRLGARQASVVSPMLDSLLFRRERPARLANASYMSNLATSYREKYKNKLEQRAKEKGFKSVDELLAHEIEKNARSKKSNETSEKPESRSSGAADKTADPTKPKASNNAGPVTEKAQKRVAAAARSGSSSNLPPSVKSLDQILCTEKIDKNITAEDLGNLWNQYHATKDNFISAAIPAETYRHLIEKSKKHPLFVLPLPRDEGIEFYIMQFEFHQVHFTSLIQYNTNQTSAIPYLTLTHYTDFIDSKGIVLMRGEICQDPKMLDSQQAQLLALQLQQFYVTGGERKKQILETFTFHPQKFNYDELIAEANRLD